MTCESHLKCLNSYDKRRGTNHLGWPWHVDWNHLDIIQPIFEIGIRWISFRLCYFLKSRNGQYIKCGANLEKGIMWHQRKVMSQTLSIFHWCKITDGMVYAWWITARLSLFRYSRNYRQTSYIRRVKSQTLNVSGLVLQLSLPNPLKPVLRRELRCSWSSADRRCSSYIWVFNNIIAD